MTILEELFNILEGKKDPKAKVRNKPDPIFSDKSSKVSDQKDHYPIPDAAHARNALARVAQTKTNPPWHKGTLSDLKKKVKSTVKRKFPSIDVSE